MGLTHDACDASVVAVHAASRGFHRSWAIPRLSVKATENPNTSVYFLHYGIDILQGFKAGALSHISPCIDFLDLLFIFCRIFSVDDSSTSALSPRTIRPQNGFVTLSITCNTRWLPPRPGFATAWPVPNRSLATKSVYPYKTQLHSTCLRPVQPVKSSQEITLRKTCPT